uniref:Uncharacterized protein n=1 Tax=Rhizophora mucronata TaxID=61149 RepID=A0A2P2JJG7_RHIMU
MEFNGYRVPKFCKCACSNDCNVLCKHKCDFRYCVFQFLDNESLHFKLTKLLLSMQALIYTKYV